MPSMDIKKFWDNVDTSGDCWVYQGRSSNGSGNGMGHRKVYVGDYKKDYAHRIAYAMAYGPIPDGMFVCHRCDNPPCVRIDHLFLGTPHDNARDMAAKKRGHKSMHRGEAHPQAKLKYEDVALIRTLYKHRAPGVRGNAPAIAIQFGVSQAAIYAIVEGRNWPQAEVLN